LENPQKLLQPKQLFLVQNIFQIFAEASPQAPLWPVGAYSTLYLYLDS